MEPDWCPGEVRGHPDRKAFRRNTWGMARGLKQESVNQGGASGRVLDSES